MALQKPGGWGVHPPVCKPNVLRSLPLLQTLYDFVSQSASMDGFNKAGGWGRSPEAGEAKKPESPETTDKNSDPV